RDLQERPEEPRRGPRTGPRGQCLAIGSERATRLPEQSKQSGRGALLMRVVLRTDVDNLGKRGDIREVADGFARNYLLPKGHAILAGSGVEAQASSMRRARDRRDAKDRESAE